MPTAAARPAPVVLTRVVGLAGLCERELVGRVIVSGSMSLDGFVANVDHSVGPLFDWYRAGVVEVANAGGYPPFTLTPESAAYWQWTERIGAIVAGRATFDITDGWKGTHPFDVPVV